jgi:hypothetical protein
VIRWTPASAPDIKMEEERERRGEAVAYPYISSAQNAPAGTRCCDPPPSCRPKLKPKCECHDFVQHPIE